MKYPSSEDLPFVEVEQTETNINKEAREQKTFVIFGFVFGFFLNQCYTSSVSPTYCDPSYENIDKSYFRLLSTFQVTKRD